MGNDTSSCNHAVGQKRFQNSRLVDNKDDLAVIVKEFREEDEQQQEAGEVLNVERQEWAAAEEASPLEQFHRPVSGQCEVPHSKKPPPTKKKKKKTPKKTEKPPPPPAEPVAFVSPHWRLSKASQEVACAGSELSEQGTEMDAEAALQTAREAGLSPAIPAPLEAAVAALRAKAGGLEAEGTADAKGGGALADEQQDFVKNLLHNVRRVCPIEPLAAGVDKQKEATFNPVGDHANAYPLAETTAYQSPPERGGLAARVSGTLAASGGDRHGSPSMSMPVVPGGAPIQPPTSEASTRKESPGNGAMHLPVSEDGKALGLSDDEQFQRFCSDWALQRKQMHQRLQRSLEASLDSQEELLLKFLRRPPDAATAGYWVGGAVRFEQRTAEDSDDLDTLHSDDDEDGQPSSLGATSNSAREPDSDKNDMKIEETMASFRSRQPGARHSIHSMNSTSTTRRRAPQLTHKLSDISDSARKKKIKMLEKNPFSSGRVSMSGQLLGQSPRLRSRWDWWMDLKEPKRTGIMFKIIKNKIFDGFVAIVIFSNSLYTAYQSNYEIQHSTSPKSDEILEPIFLCLFSGEMVLKICVHRQYTFCNEDMWWNIFDFFLVAVAAVNLIIVEAMSSEGNDVSFARSLRIFRLGKTLRILSSLRFLKELRVMLISILGSFKSLLWSFVMLGLIIFICALFFVQQMAVFIADDKPGLEELHALQLTQYGSVQQAMLTLAMASTGGIDWGETFDLVKPLGEIYAAAFVFYIMFFMFAVMNILTGIFVENAMCLSKPDEEDRMKAQHEIKAKARQDLKCILQHLDTNEDGHLSLEELNSATDNDNVLLHLQSLGIDIKDPQLFFSTLAAPITEDDGSIPINAFVDQAINMRGPASSIDLHGLIDQQQRTSQLLMQICATLEDVKGAGDGGSHSPVPGSPARANREATE